MSEEKIFLGNGTERQSQYGILHSIGINIQEAMKFQNEKGWVNLTMFKKKEPGEGGTTHYLCLDTYQKQGGSVAPPVASAPQQQFNANPQNPQGSQAFGQQVPLLIQQQAPLQNQVPQNPSQPPQAPVGQIPVNSMNYQMPPQGQNGQGTNPGNAGGFQ